MNKPRRAIFQCEFCDSVDIKPLDDSVGKCMQCGGYTALIEQENNEKIMRKKPTREEQDSGE